MSIIDLFILQRDNRPIPLIDVCSFFSHFLGKKISITCIYISIYKNAFLLNILKFAFFGLHTAYYIRLRGLRLNHIFW